MACKFGFDGVVEILAAHPKTDKQLRNKYGETPNDVRILTFESSKIFEKYLSYSFLDAQLITVSTLKVEQFSHTRRNTFNLKKVKSLE